MKTPPLIKRLLLLPLAFLSLAHAAPNLIVTTDIGGDPDDQQSMRRLMLYSNEFNILGLIASASGTPGDNLPPSTRPDLISDIVDDYSAVRSNLAQHASGYPTASSLYATIKSGNPNRGTANVGSGHNTDGSDWIVAKVDAATAPVNIVIWGGATDVAQAFYTVNADTARTQTQKDAWISKVRIGSITDQDGYNTTLKWIRDNFPGTFIVEIGHGSLNGQHMAFRGMYQNDSLAYSESPIQLIETANVSLNQSAWVNANVTTGHGMLGIHYPLVNQLPPSSRNTTGVKEGDTSSWFYFLANGLSNPDQPTWGGWGGRYAFVSNLYWNDVNSGDTHWGSTNAHVRRKWTIARWRKAYQHDFAARMDWCVKSVAQANHNPVAVLNGDTTKNILSLTAAPDAVVNLSAAGSSDADGNTLAYKWWNYADADTHTGTITLSNSTSASASFTMPSNSTGKTIHIILEVTDNGSPALTSYRRLVVTGGTPGGSTDPIAHWKFDETSGTSAADSSGNNLTGTLTNGPVWDSAGALDFDGVNDHVNIGNPAALQFTGAMTLSAWVKVESFANSGRIIAKQGGSAARSWGLNVESSGIASFQIASNASSLVLVDGPALQTGQWYLLIGVYEPGASLKLYIDGALAATNSTGIPASQFSANGLNVNIGRRPSGDLHFNGLIDDVRIYDRALTAAEVAALADSGGLEITVADTANAADWSVRANLQAGDTQYGDRTFTLSSVPAALIGSTWIRTANDSKAFTGATLVSFAVGEDTDVYVAHNDLIATKPSWLSTWTDTGSDLVNTESTPRTFSLFRKSFAAGATVSLGTNGSTAYGLYTVILQPAPSDFVVGAETILDNTASSGVTATSGWVVSTGSSGYYGTNYLHDNNANKGAESVTYTPTLAGTGLRDVYVRWAAASNRASNARYIVTHAGGSATVFQNQRVSGGTWVKIGTWSFDAGASSNVVVSNDGATDGYVIADAVRFVNVVSP